MNTDQITYKGYRYPPEIISQAVWLYHRFCLSYRDVEDLLAESGITASYETVRQWCGKFGPSYARATRYRMFRASGVRPAAGADVRPLRALGLGAGPYSF
jgi:transposase-like protein